MATEAVNAAQGAASYKGIEIKSNSAGTGNFVNTDTTRTESSDKISEENIIDNIKEVVQEDSMDGQIINTNDALKEAVDKINSTNNHTEAVFGIHEKTNRITIKIVDKESKKIIKEYPPEETLDMVAKAWELAGILVDEKR